MADNSHLGSFIRECRKGLNYTSRQVARLSSGRKDLPSISNSYLISVENGKHIPRLDKVIALADVLNVPITHFVDRCRQDLGTDGVVPAEVDFKSLLEAGKEHVQTSDFVGGLRRFRDALEAQKLAPESVSPHDGAELRLQLANCYRRLKLNRVAKEELEAFLRERNIEPLQRARGAFALADIYREEGSVFLGATVARESLRLAQEAGDEGLEGKILSSLGNLAAEEGRVDEALGLYRDAVQKLRQAGQERAARLARAKQGLILVEKGEHYKAIDLLRTELGNGREGDAYVRAWIHLGLAKAYSGAENYKSARNHARAARECAETIEAPDLLFLSTYYLWLAARQDGAADVASAAFEKLKQYRAKLDVGLQEVEHFDRLRKGSVGQGAVR